MKSKIIGILSLIILATQGLLGQKMPSDYFAEGEAYVEEKQWDKALTSFEYIVANHPRNELYPRAFYNTAYIYHQEKQFDKAIYAFKAILSSDFNEQEALGGSIMADPYTMYRHRSSEALSEIYEQKEMFDTALYYFSLSDTLYPYQHFCGNGHAQNDVKKALKYAELYSKLHNEDKAIESLLPVVFETLANNSLVLTELEKRLQSKTNLKVDLDHALSSMYQKTYVTKHDNFTNSFTVYVFRFLNTEVTVPQSWTDKEFDKNKAIEDIKKTKFYNLIEKYE